MKNKPWLRITLIQVAVFILVGAALDRIILPDEFQLGKFLLKTLIAALIFGTVIGFANYEMYKKGLQ